MTYPRVLTLLLTTLTTVTAATTLVACDPQIEPDRTEASERGPIGKADQIAGSCLFEDTDACEGQSPDGCWCDASCVEYGDCCGDVEPVCGIDDPNATCPDPDDPSVHYISDDPLQCAAILFGCEEGQVGFTDDCGCGCIDMEPDPEPTPEPDPVCPDPADETVHYISTDFLECAAVLFACDEGQELFSDECGCGCID